MHCVQKSNATWMADLPEQFWDKPLNEIAIPGSHDTTTYESDLKGGIACDVVIPKFVRRLVPLLGPCGMVFIRHLIRTQDLDLLAQLEMGIRYLDIRLCQRKHDLWTLHGLYCLHLEEILRIVDYFIGQNQKEILFLDFNHFYAMGEDDFENLCLMLQRFGGKLCPRQDLSQLTLGKMWSEGWQIIAFYDQSEVKITRDYFWPDTLCPSPWADTMDSKYLFQFLTETLAKRPAKAFHVSQGILTPSIQWYFVKFWLSIERARKSVHKPLAQWLEKQTIGPKGVNFVITDFVNDDYVESVLGLNRLDDCLTNGTQL